jgi:hypothetical protein
MVRHTGPISIQRVVAVVVKVDVQQAGSTKKIGKNG